MSEGLVSIILAVLFVLAVSLLVRAITLRRRELSYASLLVFVGLGVSILGFQLEITLTYALIIEVLLPVILFHGTTELNLDALVENAPLVLTLAVVGLPVSVLLMGFAGTVVFGFPLLVSLVFAAIILPTDPAAVLSLFQEFDAPDRLSITVEGESLLNDGVAVVIFSTFFAAVRDYQATDQPLATSATPGTIANFGSDLLVVGGGGILVGGVVGYLAHQLARRLQDFKSLLLLTIMVAYGSFVLAEQVVGVSGILAVVAAGLLMGAHDDREHAEDTEKLAFLEHVWGSASFLASTLLYVLIGVQVRISDFTANLGLILSAAVLVVVIRAVVTYPLLGLLNRTVSQPMPLRCQGLVVWAGLHTVIPVALVLSLPASFPFASELRAMVFGVAIISMVVQGLLTPYILRLTGIADQAVRTDLDRIET
ncbi:cation:proton antiporter (plasmid) [Halorientalis pallida]|uniref:cation:proton antiporter n=1 Tax=Halorientalis pallida TaxID=2479928 RepID=UPI003C6ED9EE